VRGNLARFHLHDALFSGHRECYTPAMRGVSFLSVVVVWAGCSSSSETPPPPDASLGPHVVTLTVSGSVIAESDVLEVIATVVPGASAAPVVSGQLLRSNAAVSLASFTDSAGTWNASASFVQLSAEAKGAIGQPVTVPLTARFVDDLGNLGSASTDVELACANQNASVCDGACVLSLENDSHCGGCDQACGDLAGSGTDCKRAKCGFLSAPQTNERRTCDAYCATLTGSNGIPATCSPVCETRFNQFGQPSLGITFLPSAVEGGVASYGPSPPFVEQLDCAETPAASSGGEAYSHQYCCCVMQF
jgi:hypothetical protein